MNHRKIFGGLFCAALCLSACEMQQEVLDPEISVSPTSVEFEMAANKTVVKITANCDWEAVTEQSWISIDPSKGSKDTEVTILVTANDGEGSVDRTGVVTFYGNDSRLHSAPLSVSQKGLSVDAIQTLTVAEFIQAADNATRYRLHGTVSGKYTGSYTTFNLNDETGSILVYSFSDDGIMDAADVENGAEITLTGIYTLYESKSQHEVTKATIEEYKAPEKLDRSKLKTISCADFIKYADKINYYKLTGKVTSLVSGTNKTTGEPYNYFFISDDEGVSEVEIYSASKDNTIDFATVKEGASVIVSGVYEYYKNSSSGKEYHEMIDAVIEEYTEPVITIIESDKISEIVSAEKNSEITLKNAIVAAVSKTSFLLTDGTDYILAYSADEAAKVAAGDNVTVKGTIGTYSSQPQINSPEVTVNSHDNEVPAVTATDITSEFDIYSGTAGAYIKFQGTLSISGTYYNVAVEGASTMKGSLNAPLDETGVDSYNGKVAMFEGYYLYVVSGKYITIILTKISEVEGDYFNVAPESITVEADATTASFSISTNLAWTATSKTEGFTLDETSGTGEKTVNVSFEANESTESERTATIEVVTSLGSKTVTITQKKKVSEAAGDFTSNVTWTLGANAYDQNSSGNNAQKATVNGIEVTQVLKLGTSSKVGEATLTIPAGTSKLSFYAVAWNDKVATLTLLDGETSLFEEVVQKNSKATGNPPYEMTVTGNDYYSVTFDSPLSEEKQIKVTTATGSTGKRVILFGIRAE